MGLIPQSCMGYIDDLLAIGKNNLANLRAVFERLRAVNLRLKPVKCHFGRAKVDYLGYVVSREGIAPDSGKVKAVNDFPHPQDVRTLRSFLGLASYPVVRPDEERGIELKWSSSCEEALQALKSLLINAPILAFLVFDHGFVLHEWDWGQP